MYLNNLFKEPINEGKSPHKKGTKQYKDHMAAIHAGMAEAEAGRIPYDPIADVQSRIEKQKATTQQRIDTTKQNIDTRPTATNPQVTRAKKVIPQTTKLRTTGTTTAPGPGFDQFGRPRRYALPPDPEAARIAQNAIDKARKSAGGGTTGSGTTGGGTTGSGTTGSGTTGGGTTGSGTTDGGTSKSGSGGGTRDNVINLNDKQKAEVSDTFTNKGTRAALNLLGRAGAGTFGWDLIPSISRGIDALPDWDNMDDWDKTRIATDIYSGAVGLMGAIGPEKWGMGNKVWGQIGLGSKVNSIPLGKGVVGKLPAVMLLDQVLKAREDWKKGDYATVARRIATGVAYGFIPHPAVFFGAMSLIDPDFDDVRKSVANQVGQYYNDMTKDAQDQGFYVNPAFESVTEQFIEYLDGIEVDVLGETKEAPAGTYFTKTGNLVRGKLTKDAKARGARQTDPKDNQRSKVPPVTQMTEAQFDEAAGKKDACYHKVKSRYKVWPSAYASGALVQCRKKGAKNWGNSKKK